MWRISDWYENEYKLAAENKPFVRSMADLLLNTTMQHMPGATREEVGRKLTAHNHARLEAAPSFTKYPELRGMRELVEAGWRGTQDGAELSDLQAAAYNDRLSYYHRYLCLGELEPMGCTYIYFPTTEQGPALAHNLDSTPSEAFTPPGWPAASEHLIFGTVSSGLFLDEKSPELFPAPVSKLVGRYCRSTDDAVEMLTRYNHFWGPCNAIVIDRDHNVAMIEKSACRIGVRRSPDGFGFITAMTAEDPSMSAWVADRRAASIKARGLGDDSDDAIYWSKQDKRRELMNELLEEARKQPTVEKLREFIQYRSSRANVCGDGEPLYEGGPQSEYTLKSEIWLLGKGQAMWWAKEGEVSSFRNRKPDVSYDGVWLWN